MGEPTGSLPGKRQLWMVLLIFNAWHLIWIPWLGLMPQDAYYHLYAMHPSLSYFDHPPALAWLIRLFQAFGGSHSVIVLKGMDFTATLGIQWGAYRLFRTYLGEHPSLYLTSWLAASPILLLLAFNTTPDVPLLLTWVWSLVAMRKAFTTNHLGFWLLTGLLAGLSFDSKYTGMWILIGMHVALIFSKTYRTRYRQIGPYLATLLAVGVMSPVFIWNADHHFVSFLFQSGERAATITRLNPRLFLGHIGSQLGVASPFLLIPIWIMVIRNLVKCIKRSLPAEEWFQFVFTAPFVLGFAALSILYWVKINWVMPAYLTGILMAASFLTYRWWKGHLIFGLVIHLLLAIEVFFYPIPIQSDDTWYGWDQLAHQVDSLELRYPDDFVFSADGYKTTAVLRFLNRRTYYGENILGKSALHFDYLGEDLNQLKGKDGLFIDSNPSLSQLSDHPSPKELDTYFERVEFIGDLEVKRGAKLVRHFRVFRGYNYRGPKGN